MPCASAPRHCMCCGMRMSRRARGMPRRCGARRVCPPREPCRARAEALCCACTRSHVRAYAGKACLYSKMRLRCAAAATPYSHMLLRGALRRAIFTPSTPSALSVHRLSFCHFACLFALFARRRAAPTPRLTPPACRRRPSSFQFFSFFCSVRLFVHHPSPFFSFFAVAASPVGCLN